MSIFFRLRKLDCSETIETYEKSKLLGSPVFPKSFIQKNNLDDYFFVAQINLSQLNDNDLPKNGFIYFFLNIEKYPYIPRVLYTNEEVIEVYDNINEDFKGFGDYHACLMEFTNDFEDGNCIMKEVNENLDFDCEFDIDEYISLLTIDSLTLPDDVLYLGQPDCWYMFLIKRKDLMKSNFHNVRFICFGS